MVNLKPCCKGKNENANKQIKVGVILSGGQAPADIMLLPVFTMELKQATKLLHFTVLQAAQADLSNANM